MTDLSAPKPRTFHGPRGRQQLFPMAANTILYFGAALMMAAATGNPANCTPTASGIFLGFAETTADNRTGNVAPDAEILITQQGRALLTVAKGSAFALTDVGTTIYASDGDTFTTSAGTNNILIGKIANVPAAAVGQNTADVYVDFEASSVRSL